MQSAWKGIKSNQNNTNLIKKRKISWIKKKKNLRKEINMLNLCQIEKKIVKKYQDWISI